MPKENTSLSKSEVKALGCEFYYRKYYLEKVPQHPMSWTKAGTQFHNFMDAYIKHLVEANLPADLDWASLACDGAALCDDARALLDKYLPTFALTNPMLVLGAEAFFVIDERFEPIPAVTYPGVGKRPVIAGAFAHGTLDLIERTGPATIDVTDFKTGFMPSRVDPYEAIHYAILAFAHFPWCEAVTFRWDFIRFGKTDEVTHLRSDWAQLVEAMFRHIVRRGAIVRKEGPPECDALAGLCGYCALECPLRVMAMNGDTIFKPIQTDEDAREAARVLAAFRSAKGTLESQLRYYLGERGTVELGDGKVARMDVSHTPQLQLRTVMAALGIELPETSPAFDVPLDKLVVNNSEFKRYASARKREGLLETVTASVPTKTREVLHLGEMEDE